MKLSEFLKNLLTIRGEIDRSTRQLLMEPLEPRILYSAAPVEAPPEQADESGVQEPAQVSEGTPAVEQQSESGTEVGNGDQVTLRDVSWLYNDDAVSADVGGQTVQYSDSGHKVQYDDLGNLIHEDAFSVGYIEPEEAPGDGSVVWQNYDLSQTFNLHSKPDSNFTIYLDFDGHTTEGTLWNNNYGETIVTPAYSMDGDRDSFNNTELARIQRVWAAVAEDFIPFDVNVTTEEPDLDWLIKENGSDTHWGIRVVIGPNTWYDSAGGVAYRTSFNWSTDTPTYVFNSGENGIIEAASHEIGHTVGLGHDGTDSGGLTYYAGHGSGNTSWGPIMGASYGISLTQWSKGEYNDADNFEDDLSIITTQNGFDYRVDDYGNSRGTSTEILAKGDSTISTTYGIIERNTDVDYLSFWASAGNVSLNIDTVSDYYNLDILATIYDESGNVVATSNPTSDVDASFNFNLSESGQYFLAIEGTGMGNPLTTGYSDYGSLGNYRVTGSAVAYPLGPPPSVTSATGAATATVHALGDTISVSLDFSGAVTLSSAGQARISLNVGGVNVLAVHTGATSGTRLTFQTTISGGVQDVDGIDVVENSLTLLNGATLLDSVSRDALLTHSTEHLANDLVDGIRPTVDIVNVTPDPRYSDVDSIAIQFSESVSGFDISDLSLTLNGGVVDISGLTVTGSGSSYAIDLSSVTAGTGNYVLQITASGSGVQDAAGNTLTTNAVDGWTTLPDIVGEITKVSDGIDPDFGAGDPTDVVFRIELKTSSGVTYVNDTGSAITYSFTTFGSATRGSDYGIPPSSVSIENGESFATITVVVINDSGIESTESVSGRISNASIGGVSETRGTASASIFDNDRAVVSIEDATVSEDGGSLEVTATLTNAVVGGFSVDLKLVGGSATAREDFSGTTRTFTFQGNNGETRTISIPILDDLLAEGDETINLHFEDTRGTSNPGAINITDTAVLTIQDDDLPLAYLTEVSNGIEANGASNTDIVYKIELRNAAGQTVTNGTGGDITFDLNLSGTATAGSDFDAPPISVGVADGASMGTFTLSIRDDNEVESTETVIATISNASLGSVGSGPATATIADFDTASITLGDAILNEEDGSMIIVATLDNSVSGGFSVDVNFTDITATGGLDYDNTTQTLVFSGTVGETVNLFVPLFDDFDIEQAETFRVSFSNLVPVSASASVFTYSDTGIGTIEDDDVSNIAPVLPPIEDQVISYSEGSRVIGLGATDADGDAVTYTVEAFAIDEVAVKAYALDQRYDFRPHSAEYENVRGFGEKYFLNGAGEALFILPDGSVYLWGGSIASSTLLDTLDNSYHANLSTLYNVAEPVADPIDAELTVSGDDLTITPGDGYTGGFRVRVTASDGVGSDSVEFAVEVVI